MANDISNLDLMLGKTGRESAPIPDAAGDRGRNRRLQGARPGQTGARRRQGRRRRDRARLVRRDGARRCATGSSIAGSRSNRASHAEGRKHVYYLSLEFLIGRLFADVVENLRMTETGARRARRPRRRSRPDAPRRARCGARQWRPRPARGLPDGEHGEPRDAGLRLRHPLRPRPVPPGDPRRLAAGISPRTGCPSAIRGSSRGRRSSTTSSSAAGSSMVATPSGPGAVGVASRRDDRGGGLRHAGRRLARPPRQPAAAVVGARRRPAAARHVQPGRPCRRAVGAGPRRGDLEDPLSQRQHARPAASCGCGRSISSSRRRCRTSCSGTCSTTATCRRCRTAPRSSSTTRIRASRSPS